MEKYKGQKICNFCKRVYRGNFCHFEPYIHNNKCSMFSDHFCKCGTPISADADICIDCQDIIDGCDPDWD